MCFYLWGGGVRRGGGEGGEGGDGGVWWCMMVMMVIMVMVMMTSTVMNKMRTAHIWTRDDSERLLLLTEDKIVGHVGCLQSVCVCV